MRLLTPDEHQRAEAFRHPQGRTAFVVCRFALRTLLAAYTGMPGDRLVFQYGPNGRPELRDLPSLRFNLSHAGSRGALAFAWDAAIGVDIEDTSRQADFAKLARRFFTPAEFQRLRYLTADEQRETFFSYWTCKEALAKATGVGVPAGLKRVTVTVATGGAPAVTWMAEEPTAPERWVLHPINPWPGYAGAVAVEARGRSFQGYDCAHWLEKPRLS